MNVPDHPMIRNCEIYGYPDGPEPDMPRCPVCGEECETIYKAASGEIVGCDMCITTTDAWDEQDCFPES